MWIRDNRRNCIHSRRNEKEKETWKEEEMINECNNFIKFAKEKGFEENLYKNKKDIIADFISYECLEFFKV